MIKRVIKPPSTNNFISNKVIPLTILIVGIFALAFDFITQNYRQQSSSSITNNDNAPVSTATIMPPPVQTEDIVYSTHTFSDLGISFRINDQDEYSSVIRSGNKICVGQTNKECSRHPDKLLFFDIGQFLITGGPNNQPWYETLSFISEK